MQIRKKKLHQRIFSFAAVYRLISNYGEEPRIPFGIITGIPLIVFLYYLFEDISTVNYATFFDSVRKTLQAFLPFADFPKHNFLLEIILRAIMLPMVGLLFISPGRKLERRFRH